MEKKFVSCSLLDDLFESDNYPDNIKEELINVGSRIHKIVKYGCYIPNIMIYNYNRNELMMFKEGLKKVFNKVIRNKNIVEYDMSFSSFSRKNIYFNNSMVSVDDIDFFCNHEMINCAKLLKLIKDKKLSFVFLSTNEYCINTNAGYDEFFSKITNGINIRIVNDSFSIDDFFNIVNSELKSRNIYLDISEDNFKKLIFKLINNGIINYSEGVNTLLSDLTSVAIIDGKKEISEEDFVFLYGVVLDNGDIKNEEVKQDNNAKKMFGLKEVKNEIKSLENYLSFIKKCDSKDKRMYLNLFFVGNPGTGKTTMARMFKDILFKLGYIKKNKITEIVPNDLVGEHVGETRGQTREILKRASGGLLFIDEAYLLYSKSYSKTGQNPFMEEALVELMKYMEDPSNIVIFAGYPKEMRDVYNANPGLRSRIFKEIEFKDYTNEELYKILNYNLNNFNIKLDKNIKKDIYKYIDSVKKDKDFGNARYIEKFAQVLINNHANRKIKDENYVIDINDIPKVIKEKKVKKMGFVGE